MLVREIEPSAWKEFFESFSRMHRSWLTTLKVHQPGGDVSVEVREQPLADVHLVSELDDRTVVIQIGEPRRHLLSEALPDPVSVKLRETNRGAHKAVEIDTVSGVKATLQFRSTALPQILDGMAALEVPEPLTGDGESESTEPAKSEEEPSI